MNRIDLHTHSVFSDGTLTPEELVALASHSGLKAIALTDHDTVEGVSWAIAAGNLLGLRSFQELSSPQNIRARIFTW